MTSATAATLTITVADGVTKSYGDGSVTNSGVIAGALSLVKSGSGTQVLGDANTYTGTTTITAGTLTLSGANTFTGAVTISGGTLSVGSIENGGVTGNLGAATNAAANLVLNGGTLQYTGTGTTSSDRNFTLGTSGGTIDLAAASGTFTLSGSATISGTTARTLTLTSSSGALAGIFSGTLGDNTGATALTKTGSNTWTLSGNNTYTGATTVSAGTLTAGHAAAFGTSTLTINGGTLALGAFTITNNVTLTSGTLSSTTGTIPVDKVTPQSGTISAILISGTGTTLTKNTSGTLILSGANTFTGTTTVSAGELQLSKTSGQALAGNLTVSGGTAKLMQAAQIATAKSLVVSSGTFDLQGFNQTLASVQITGGTISGTTGILTSAGTFDVQAGTVGAILAGSVGLNKTTASTATLSGANTFTGTTTVSAGELQLSKTSGQALAGNLTVSGGTAKLMQAAQIATTKNLVVSSGTFDLQGFNQTLASVQITGGTISGTTGILTSAGTFDVQAGTVSAILGGSVGLAKTTSGTVTLSGANTFTGTTTVSAGELQLSKTSGQALAGNLTVSGGTAKLMQAAQIATAKSLVVGSGTFDLQGFNQTLAGVQITGGTITGTTGVLTSTFDFDVQAGTVSAILGGSVGLNKTTSSSVTLSGANTYTGTTTVSGGTLTAADGALASTTSITVNGATLSAANFNSAATLTLDATATATISGNGLTVGALSNANATDADALNFTGTGTITAASLSGAGKTTFGANATITGGISAGIVNVTSLLTANVTGGTVSAGTLTGNLSGGNVTVTGLLTGNVTSGAGTILAGSMTGNVGSSVTVTGLLTGNITAGTNALGSISSTTVSGGTNIVTGTALITTVSNGTTTVGGVATLTTVSNGTLNLNGATSTITHLNGGTIALGSTALTVSDGTYAGGLSGANGSLTKDSADTLTLSGANTYEGLTSVSAGILAISHGSALGSNANGTTVASGAELRLLGGITVASEALTLNGSGVSSNGALRNFSGDNTVAGAITLASDTQIISTAGTLTLTGGLGGSDKNLTVGGAGNVTISTADLALGAGTLTKAGAGTLTLSGANTYAGATTVSNGVLAISHAAALGSDAAGTTVADGAELRVLGGITVATEALTLNGAGISSNGALRNFSGDNTIAGAITLASAARIVSTAGSLTLTGAITGTDTNLTFGGNGNTTVSTTGLSLGTGSLTKTGTGLLLLSVANTYSGGTTISGGSIKIGVTGALGSGAVNVGGVGTLDLNNLTIANSIVLADGATLTGGTLPTTSVPTSGRLDIIITGSSDLEKNDSGRLELTAASTYTGATKAAGGTVAVSDFGNGSSASPLGVTALTDPSKLVLSAGATLEFTGTTATSTARSFTVSGSAGIAAGTGAAALTFTEDAKIALSGAAPELKLTANNSGTNVFRANLSAADLAAGNGLKTLTIDGTGVWVIGGNVNRFKQDIRVDVTGGTIALEYGALPATAVIAIADGAKLRWEAGNTNDLSSNLSITAGATAKLDLGANDVVFNAAPSVAAGSGSTVTIEKQGTGSLKIAAGVNAGTVNVSLPAYSGLLTVNGSVGNVSLANGSTLGGSGTVGNVTTARGSHVSPGNSPGTLTTGNFGLVSGTYYDWQVQDAKELTLSPGYDKLSISGNFDLRSVTSSDRVTISVISLSNATTVGNPLNFDPPGTAGVMPLTFTFATVGGSVLLNQGVNISDLFTFDLSQFTYSNGSASNAGLWSISWDGGSLVTLTAVPEPSTYGLGLGALALAAAAIRRRKQKAKA